MRVVTFVFAVATVCMLGMASQAQNSSSGAPSPAGAKVYFISPHEGEAVDSPVIVRFGLKGMGVAPAGVEMENTGHHHLLIDHEAVTAASPLMKTYMPSGQPDVMHFGKGQTETELKLPPGQHTLQLVLGDQDHHPHTPPVFSDRITITVK